MVTKLKKTVPIDFEQAGVVSEIFKSFSHPIRLQILCRLSRGAASVQELQEHLKLEQAPTSQFLARLRSEGRVKCERQGNQMLYEISDPRLVRLLQKTAELFCQPRGTKKLRKGALLLWVLGGVFSGTVSGIASPSEGWKGLWEDYRSSSLARRATQMELESAQMALERARRHWAPRLSLMVGGVSTDSPGTTLFSTLESRTLVLSDLSPSRINEPPRQVFVRGVLHLDLPLYEGGAPTFKVRALRFESESRALEVRRFEQELYVELLRGLGKSTSYARELGALEPLLDKVERVLRRYQVGVGSNPVGYSGRLGLMALKERLLASLDQARTESASAKATLVSRLGGESARLERVQEEWLASQDLVKTLGAHLEVARNVDSGEGNGTESYKIQSLRLQSRAAEQLAEMEKAQFLPKLGVFAQTQAVSAPRDLGTASEFGAYLQWSLFRGESFGALKGARARAESSSLRAQHQARENQISKSEFSSRAQTLERSRARLQTSLKLTAEQVELTERLFERGNVSVLSWVEILGRRMDVVREMRELELGSLEIEFEKFLTRAEGV